MTLGDLTERAETRIRSGADASLREVVGAGLQEPDSVLLARVQEALADPRPAVSLAEGFARLRKHTGRRRAALDV